MMWAVCSCSQGCECEQEESYGAESDHVWSWEGRQTCLPFGFG